MKKLFLIPLVLLMMSCDRVQDWQMETKTTEQLIYQGKGVFKTNNYTRDWVFRGTEDDARDQCTTKQFTSFEYPYTVIRTSKTTIK